MGDSVQWHQDGRPLEPTRTGYAYQLPGTFAVKTFLKDQTGASVLIQLDNQTAVAYINNMGGTVSPQLTDLAKELWMWALANDIVLSVEHIPGILKMQNPGP